MSLFASVWIRVLHYVRSTIRRYWAISVTGTALILLIWFLIKTMQILIKKLMKWGMLQLWWLRIAMTKWNQLDDIYYDPFRSENNWLNPLTDSEKLLFYSSINFISSWRNSVSLSIFFRKIRFLWAADRFKTKCFLLFSITWYCWIALIRFSF